MTTLVIPEKELILPERLQGDQQRAAAVEELDRGAGTILVRAVPYDHEVELFDGYFESFEPGAFARAAAAPHRIKMHNEHGGPIVGAGVEVDDRKDGAWVRFRFAKTAAGQEARELAFDEILDQVSVSFRPIREWIKVTTQGDETHLRHLRAWLKNVDLVSHGAYGEQAYVDSVRDADTERDRERVELEAELARLDAERRERLARLERLSH